MQFCKVCGKGIEKLKETPRGTRGTENRMSASQAKEMSSIPSIREGEGFISMEDVRLVTSFVKLMVKFCNEKRAAATAAKKCVCVENGIMQQPCVVKLAEIDCAFKLFCNEMFDDHDTVYKRIVFGKAMGNLTAIVNHVFEQPMLTNGHVPFFGKSMRSVWFGAKLLGADSALIIARNLPSYSEKKKAAMIAFNANFVNHIHASARVIQVAFNKFKLLQLKCAICTRQDPHGKIKMAAIKAALIELEEYADVLKKSNLFCPTIMATTPTEVIKEVADRLLIPFEDNYLQLARLIFQRLVGKHLTINSPEVSCETWSETPPQA